LIWLAVGFGITAFLYASVGFGGGSTYSALLVLVRTKVSLIPVIGPICNIIVTIGGTFRYSQAGLMPWRRLLPLVLISAPCALLGGLTPIKEPVFLSLLAISLGVAGLGLLFQTPRGFAGADIFRPRRAFWRDLIVSAALGFLAGLVGLGGGIFMAPYLHFTHWGQPKQIAATASAYILINSTAGLIGQVLKMLGSTDFTQVLTFWPLAAAVFLGGQLGSGTGIKWLSPSVLRRATGVLILFVASQLAWKLWA
jgi:uncharacterized protein